MKEIIKKFKGATLAVILLISLLTIIVTPAISDDFDPQAGTGIVSWSPSSTDVEVGDDFNVTLYINTGGDSTRGMTIRILLFNDTQLGLANITPKSAIWNTTYFGDWASAPQQDGGKLHNDVGNITYIQGGDAMGAGWTGNNSVLLINMTALEVGVLNLIIPTTAPWNPGQAGIEVTDMDSTSWYNTSINIHPQQILGMSADMYNYTTINITGMIHGSGSDNVTLCGKVGSYPTGPEDSVLYNGTNTTYNHTSLLPCTTYYYRAWGWNNTEKMHSVDYVSDYATTQCYTNFSFAGIVPVNSSVQSNCTYDIPINLTVINSRGRSFSYWINASNGQSTSGTGQAANTSIGRTLTSLSHRTNYQWNVTVSDPISGDSYIQTYNFTTGSGGGAAPVADTPIPENGNTSMPISLTFMAVHVTDAESDPIKTWFFWSNGTLIGTDASTASGGTASITPATTLNSNTTYSWYVITNDSCQNTTSSTWTFTTDIVNTSITKEWHVVDSTNQIICYINVSNIGEVNLTNVNVTDTWDANLVYGGADPINDSGVSNSWTIPWLNLSGYENHWYNITLYLNLSGPVANGTTFSDTVTATANYTVNASSPTVLTMCYYAYKEPMADTIDWNTTSLNWSINITNCGDFYLHWIQVNETYSPNLTYHSSNITPGYNGTLHNTTFNITQIVPGSSFHLWILMNTSVIAGKNLINGSKIWNNITIDTNQTTPALTSSPYIYSGATTTHVRITYHTQFTDIISITNSVFIIIGVVLMIALLLGAVFLFYRFKGGSYE